MLDHRIHAYVVEQLTKEFQDDITLVAGKLDKLIRENTINDVRFIVRELIRATK